MNFYFFAAVFFPMMVSSFWIPQKICKKTSLSELKNYDPYFYETYDIFDKFEYYSILGNKDKQKEYMEKINLYLKVMKNINEKNKQPKK